MSNFSHWVCFWWLRGSNFIPLEDSGTYIYIYMLLLWEVADNVTIVKALVERAAASDAVKASFGYEDFAMDGWIRLNKKCKNII